MSEQATERNQEQEQPRGERNVAALATRPPTSQLIQPAAPMQEIKKAFEQYKELCENLLDESDVQRIGGRLFRKKSAWRKLSTAMGVSITAIERNIVREGRTVMYAEFVSRATAPNGRTMDGWGAADLFERCCERGCEKNHTHCPAVSGDNCPGTTHWSHPNHDIPATAETRSKNRAASDLFGMGEVSAEEVAGEGEDTTSRRSSGVAVSDDPLAKCPGCKSQCVDYRQQIEKKKVSEKHPKWKCSNQQCTAGRDDKPWVSWDTDPWKAQRDQASPQAGSTATPANTDDDLEMTATMVELNGLIGEGKPFRAVEVVKLAQQMCEAEGEDRKQWPSRLRDVYKHFNDDRLRLLINQLRTALEERQTASTSN